jgi:hypothetical protein
MQGKYVEIDHTQVFNSTELARSGFSLGQRGYNRLGEFVLSEASEDISAHMIVTSVARTSFANRTITCASPYTQMSFDPGATVVVNAYAGCIITTRDDSHYSRNGIIKSHNGAVSGGTLTVDLVAALEGAIGANAEVYIFDADYVEMAAVTGLLALVVGVAPVAVDQSVQPYFWRQVSGICAILDGTTTTAAAALRQLCPGDGTEGWAIENATTAADDVKAFATVLIAPTAADHLTLARLHGLLS